MNCLLSTYAREAEGIQELLRYPLCPGIVGRLMKPVPQVPSKGQPANWRNWTLSKHLFFILESSIIHSLPQKVGAYARQQGGVGVIKALSS